MWKDEDLDEIKWKMMIKRDGIMTWHGKEWKDTLFYKEIDTDTEKDVMLR